MKLIHTAACFAALAHTFKFAPDKGGESGGTTDEEILNAVKGVQKNVEQKFDELDKATKKTIEELTIAKNNFSGLASDIQTVQATMKKLQGQLVLERRMAHGDPVQRIIQDEEKRTLFNALVRRGIAQKIAGVRFNSDQKKALELFDQAQQRTGSPLTEGGTPGSTYINAALDRDVYDVVATYGIWNSFESRPLSTRTTVMPVKTARPVATYVAEGVGDTPDTAKAGTSVTATLATARVLLSVSEELLQDSEIDVTADVMDDFAEALAFKMDWACTQADGGADSTDGGFTGIFGGGGTAAGAAAGNVSMETLDFEDWTAVVIAASAIATRGLKWWMHPSILVRSLHTKDGHGRPIFLTAVEAPAAGNVGSILGYPVVTGHQCPSANTTSSKVAVLGDPRGARIGLRNGIEFKSSDQFGFDEYSIYFRGISRHAFKIKSATAFYVLTNAAS